jgi:hypothetical protein
VNALANPEVGAFLNEHFVSAFQKVGTFRIVNGQKQGGNVASYFCAQDGRVLHVIAGPVNAQTLLREARWVVNSVKQSLQETKTTGKSFKAQFRQAHADRLRKEFGMSVKPVMCDSPSLGKESGLTYRDPSGQPLAPVLPAAPIEGPKVSFTPQEKAAFEVRRKAALKNADGRTVVSFGGGCRFAPSNQALVHSLLAAHAMKKIESLYGSIFEGILGEKISTKPVIVETPFPWVGRR